MGAFRRAEAIASQNPGLLNWAMQTRMAAMRGTLADDGRDRRFAELVDEIRLGVSETYLDEGEFAYFKQEDGFPKLRGAIEEYFGLAVGTAEQSDVLRVIERRPQPIQEILVDALSECRRMAPKGQQPVIAWLTSVIDAADTNPWQERARAAVAARDWAGIERMLTGEQAANRPAARLLRLVGLVPVDRARKQESICCAVFKSPIRMTSGRHTRLDMTFISNLSGTKLCDTSPRRSHYVRAVRARNSSLGSPSGTKGGRMKRLTDSERPFGLTQRTRCVAGNWHSS